MTAQDLQLSCPEGAVEVDDLVGLAKILDPDVHVAIWRRPVDQRIHDLLTRDAQVPAIPSIRTVEQHDDPALRQRIEDLIPMRLRSGDPAGAAALVDDVHYVCGAFGELVCADEMMIAFEATDHATCPRFHVDRVGIRMLVTYRGPGTEWLENAHVDRQWLGHAGMVKGDQKSGLMKPGAIVRQVPTFAVVLLKGEAWPDSEGFGAVHRSPNPEGEPRTVLRVDVLNQR